MYAPQLGPLARPTWTAAASCAGKGPDMLALYFSRHPTAIEACIELCRTCPVISECAADARRHEAEARPFEIHGTRAGMSALQRVELYRHAAVG
jgi:hypothetical protein